MMSADLKSSVYWPPPGGRPSARTLTRRRFVKGGLCASAIGGVLSGDRVFGRPAASGTAPDGRPIPVTGVTISTTDRDLSHILERAETLARRNIKRFADGMRVLVEGAGYRNVWLETQPMGGAMYAKRNLELGLNNQLIFMQNQRLDGRLPGMVVSLNGKIVPHFEMLQGYYFPDPAFQIYLLLHRDKVFLGRLYTTLKAYDQYLWRTRRSLHRPCLETWCVWDTGEDNSTRYQSSRLGNAPDACPGEHPPLHACTPFESMDIMGFSHDGRHTLARVSRELANGEKAYWLQQAADVRRRLKARLWLELRHACFDRNKTGAMMPVLIHNNLRAMWYGAMSQSMADAWIRHHLFHPREFWPAMPLPSIAVSDPKFRNVPRNNWSGQPEGLTYQRAIRALEDYGHYAEVGLIGEKLLHSVIRNGVFTQQWDPFTTRACGPDGYGPTILSVLEYSARMYGVDIYNDHLLWSGRRRADTHFHYTQRWGDAEYELENSGSSFHGRINGQTIFHSSTGVRVVTDLHGGVKAIIGIAPHPCHVRFHHRRRSTSIIVRPNEVFSVRESGEILPQRHVPFDYPFQAG